MASYSSGLRPHTHAEPTSALNLTKLRLEVAGAGGRPASAHDTLTKAAPTLLTHASAGTKLTKLSLAGAGDEAGAPRNQTELKHASAGAKLTNLRAGAGAGG